MRVGCEALSFHMGELPKTKVRTNMEQEPENDNVFKNHAKSSKSFEKQGSLLNGASCALPTQLAFRFYVDVLPLELSMFGSSRWESEVKNKVYKNF